MGHGKKTSIIVIDRRGGLGGRHCLKSIVDRTDDPREVTIFSPENGEDQDPGGELRGIARAVFSPTFGHGSAVNEALRAATGAFICVIDGSSRVSRGWLDRLVSFLDEGRGDLVSPAVTMGSLNYDFDRYADAYTRRCGSLIRPEAHGYCMVFKRELLDRIGPFDHRPSVGFGPEKNFLERGRKNHLKMMTLGRSLIHYWGNACRESSHQGGGGGSAPGENARDGRGLCEGSGRMGGTGCLRGWIERLRYGHEAVEMDGRSADRRARRYGYTDENHPERIALLPYCVGKGIEVGCGHRKTAPHVIGVDILPKGEPGEVGCVKGRVSVADLCAPGDALKMFRDGELDFVISRHNLEHYVDVIKTLQEWKRVLRIGGLMAHVLPDETEIDTIPLDPTHKHAFTPASYARLLGLIGGFKIIEIEAVIPNWSFMSVAKRIA